MKTAKDYYYDYYTQDKDYNTIQSRIDLSKLTDLHPSFSDRNRIAKIKKYKPVYSNDLRMDTLFREVIAGCNDEIKESLKNVFIVTHFDAAFQAYINEYPGGYEGSLIFLNLGLTSAIIEYSILFAQYTEYIFATEKQKIDLKKVVIDSAKTIAKSQISWRKAGLYNLSSFESSFPNLPRKTIHDHVAPYASAIKFILCHEIAHTCLGHLYNREDFCYKYFGITFSDIMQSTKNHQNEFHADIFSLLLASGFYKNSNINFPRNFRFMLEQAIGALLTFTVLGQQTINTSESSKSHPSIENRFGIIINTLRLFMDENIFPLIAGMMFDFQGLLYRTQKVGLGINVLNDYNLFEL